MKTWKDTAELADRRFALLASILLVASVIFGAAPAVNAAGVVIFKTKDIGPYNQAVEGFLSQVKQKPVVFDMNGDDRQGLAMVEQIRSLEPQVVFAVGTKAAKIAKEKFPEFPVIFSMVLNPDRNGVLGPNTTGILLQIPYTRQFQLLKTIMPNVKVVGVLFDPAKTEDNVTLAVQEAQQVGVKLVPVEVASEKDVPSGLRELLAQNIDLLWLTTDSTVLNKDTFAYIVTATLEKNIPLMAYQSSFVRAGAFVALAPSYPGIGEQAGKMATRILQGTKVTDIPIEPPDGNNLALNLKVAGQIGISVKQDVIDLAEIVVKP